MTARGRILAWVLVVVLLALAGTLLATRLVLRDQLERRLDGEISHEVRKLRAYLESPAARQPSVDALLRGYLEQNIPDRDETFFSIVGGTAAHRSAVEPPVRLDTNQGLVKELSGATTPRYGSIETAVGSARYGVIPVSVEGDNRRSALVIVEFVDHAAGEVDDVLGVMAAMSGAALILAGLVGWLVTGRILAPVREVRLAAEQIGESDLTRRIAVTGSDDVAALGRTFNTMLDRLERAFADQCEFIDNAGHELRTPITVIRGHLELMTEDDLRRRRRPPARSRWQPLVPRPAPARG